MIKIEPKEILRKTYHEGTITLDYNYHFVVEKSIGDKVEPSYELQKIGYLNEFSESVELKYEGDQKERYNVVAGAVERFCKENGI
jgi:hypothetical protein